MIKKIDDLQDSVVTHKMKLVPVSSEKDFLLNERILEVVQQVAIQGYYYQKKDYSVNYRDKFMAENAAWMLDYFKGEKVVVWAHNGHIANNSGFYGSGSLGNYLDLKMSDNYATVGFLFSRGTFTAVGMEGNQYTGLKNQVIDADPKENSLNYVMDQCKESVFSVKIGALLNHKEWYNEIYYNNMQYFSIGAVFNNVPKDYYGKFSPGFFDYIIYFDKSNASVILQ